MSPTALELTPVEWKRYDPVGALRQRAAAERAELTARRRRAWRTARRAGRLYAEYGAEKVLLFGSLARSGSFTRWSDIDLAAWGIPAERYFGAVAAVSGLSAEFKIDLVDPAGCSPELRQVIEAQGKLL